MTRLPAAAAALAAALLTSLLLAATAAAALPSNRDRTIVPGASIGGVKLGIGGRKAVATWGPSDCAKGADMTCHYETTSSGANFNTGNAAFELSDGKVAAVSITSAYDFDRNRTLVPSIGRALAKYKTSEGIGLGATIAQVKRAYPAARGRTTAGVFARYTLGPEARTTLFSFAAVDGTLRLYAIRIGLYRG